MPCASSWFDSIWSDFICTYVEFRKPDTAWMFCSTHPTDYEFDVWGSDNNMFLLLAFSYEWLNLGPYFFNSFFPTTYTHKYYMIFLWWQTLIHKKKHWMNVIIQLQYQITTLFSTVFFMTHTRFLHNNKKKLSNMIIILWLSHLKLFTDVDTNYNCCPYKKIVDK